MRAFTFLIFVRAELARFRAARQGLAAIEFALILPVMALLYLGTFEIAQEISIKRQVALTAETVALIVTQYSSISASQTMPDILGAAKAVLTPYPSTNAVVTVTCITIDSKGAATVSWSQSSSGSGRTVGSSVTVPSQLDTPNTTLIFGETTYNYTPAFDYLKIGSKTLYSSIYMSPREPGTITLTS
jgi:Flp pilus assembly protein TadG